MLSSLFGNFRPRGDGGDAGAASHAGPMSQAPMSDSEAIRANLTRTRANLSQSPAMVTLLDPMQVWEQSPVTAMAQATGALAERVDMRSMSGRRRVGQVARAALPLGGQGLVKVYAVDPEVPASEARSIALAMSERSHMTAVILGPDEAGRAAAVRALARAVARPSWECRHLVFLLQGEEGLASQSFTRQDWPADLRLQWLPIKPGPHGLWQALTRAWAPQHIVALPAPAPSRPAAMPVAPRALPHTVEAFAADPEVQALALVDMSNGQLRRSYLGGALALETVAQDMCASWSLQAPLTDFDQGAPAELLLLRQQGFQWLRPCGHPRGVGVLMVLSHRAELEPLRHALLQLDLNGAWAAALLPPAASDEADEAPTIPLSL
ncbi:hypothetical protein BurJ1DRAFT_2529 [Burkholderiales bacterium JOSHI_001]|nr:hypothetical protein BurJ1DRAFT_2529 [Burkholderiales bacterium JOSHI_001]